MKVFSNKEIAKLLREIAAAYTVKGNQRFKVVAYENAADSVEHATSELKDLWESKKLGTVPGLGVSIQGHIDELFKRGKVKHFEDVKKDLPQGMFKLLDIRGMGPKSAYKLATELKIKDVAGLESQAKQGKIRKLEGFGEKSEQEILDSIKSFQNKPKRYLLAEAFSVAERIKKHLFTIKECEKVETLGSLRRMVATVGDLDFAVSSKSPAKVIEHFQNFKEVKKVLEAGPRKAAVELINGMQVDLMVETPDAFGALLQHFTGSKNHNVHLRELAIKRNMSVSDYGIKVKGKIKKFKSEEEFYKFLKMDVPEPELREDQGEIEAAISGTLPKTVNLADIKGDIHIHSNYPIEPSHDLGKHSFKDMIEKAKKLNYEYIGLSDHSPSYSTHTKKEIINIIEKRTRKIEQLKSSIKGIRILNLLEIDILANGSLSVPPEGLKLLDFAIAGIHSAHNQPKQVITRRITSAIESPHVRIIAHPTNRLISQRDASNIDWPEIYKDCKRTNTYLEINSWPSRLDLVDTLVKEAVAQNIKMVINTDSHTLSHMDNMKYGISVAKRGWATKKDIINTLPWVEFRKLFRL